MLSNVDVDSTWIAPADAVDYINVAQNKFGSPAKNFEADTIANVDGIRIWSIVARKPGAASFRMENDDLSQKIFVGIEVINIRK